MSKLIVVDISVSRFCELVEEINSQNKDLNIQKHNFYSQGESFEELYQWQIKEIRELQDELTKLLKVIVK